MRRFETDEYEQNGKIENLDMENENTENDNIESDNLEENSHFSSTYILKPNEKYEVNTYSYETDRYGRIKRCEGTLHLEEGKRNTAHQTRAGGEYRLERDEGGHLIASRFGGSEKVDNIVPMDYDVNHYDYKNLENTWADEIKKGNKVDVRIRCQYEGESTRPESFVVIYKVTDQNGFTRSESQVIENKKHGDD